MQLQHASNAERQVTGIPDNSTPATGVPVTQLTVIGVPEVECTAATAVLMDNVTVGTVFGVAAPAATVAAGATVSEAVAEAVLQQELQPHQPPFTVEAQSQQLTSLCLGEEQHAAGSTAAVCILTGMSESL